jgi:hypothetical protein
MKASPEFPIHFLKIYSTRSVVHGHAQSMLYHLPASPGYENISPLNVVMLPTEAAARNVEYRKAKNCL